MARSGQRESTRRGPCFGWAGRWPRYAAGFGPWAAAGEQPVPPWPADALPLRSQRSAQDAQAASVAALATLARQAALETAPDLETGVRDRATESSEDELWAATATLIREWDRSVQDELARRDDHHANAYLLGRGLAECYWGHGAPSTWTHEGADTAVSPLFLLGDDRRRELTRMLGRLDPDERDPLTAAALSGSLEAWGAVVADPVWVRSDQLPPLCTSRYGAGTSCWSSTRTRAL